MEKSLLSPNWYRVAAARPCLRSHAKLHRHHYRGQLWYVLQDPTSGRFLRFTPAAYVVISLMNGSRSVQEIWDLACERLGDDVLTQDELIALLSQLHQSDALRSDGMPDVAEISERGQRERSRRRLMAFINPLAVRIPLIDPDRFLGRTLPIVRPFLGWAGAALFVALVSTALVLAGIHWDELTNNIVDRVFATESLFLLLFTYPFVKSLHELGHGYALKHFGGEVHEIGLMFLVFVPVPYVDASDTVALRSKWQRAFVGAAGIIVECTLAAIAMFVWLGAEEGLVRAIAFNVMLIGGVSTVLFNGNPLLRFDGYYVFSDLIESPNLGNRSNKYLGYLMQRYVFRLEHVEPPPTGPREPAWLVAYAIGSFCYRIFIMAVIIAVVATRFFFIGVILAIWSTTLMLGLPLVRHVRFLLTSPVLRRNRGRTLAISGGLLAALAVFLTLLPLPYSTVTEGIVWTPDEATVVAGTAGVVTEVIAEPNGSVRAGDALFRLEDDFLDAQVRVLEAQVSELRLTYESLDTVDPAEARIVQERLQAVSADLALHRQRQTDLTVRAAHDGMFIVSRPDDLPGRFVRQGEILSFVSPPEKAVVRVVVPESQADLVRNRVRGIDLKFPRRVEQTVGAVVNREVPALTDTLPSAALSTLGGGAILVDPTESDRLRALSNLLHLELAPEPGAALPAIGSRVHVRFRHGLEPLGFRAYRSLRQVFLRQFSV